MSQTLDSKGNNVHYHIKNLKINEFILSCPRFALSLHKKSCISKYFMPDGQGEQLNIFQEQTIIYRKYDSFFQNSITKRYCYRS